MVETSFGEQKTITLSDGSTVLLNAKSKLTYPEQFPKNNRQLSLEGEALFSVSRDPNRPFSVDANSLKTTVLGTVFNISAYQNDSLVQVSLIEGAVRIHQQNDSMLLKPMEQSVFDLRNSSLSKENFDPNNVLAWKDNKLILSKTTFSELKKIIDRRYGVEIVLEEAEIAKYTVSGTFDNPELKTLLATVCAARSLKQERLESNAIRLSIK